jgi:hypothetical protein
MPQASGYLQVVWIVTARNTSKHREGTPNGPLLLLLLTGMPSTRECDYFLKPMFAWTVWPVAGIVTQIVTPHDGSLVVFFELSCRTY